jgi:hypothetical protein
MIGELLANAELVKLRIADMTQDAARRRRLQATRGAPHDRAARNKSTTSPEQGKTILPPRVMSTPAFAPSAVRRFLDGSDWMILTTYSPIGRPRVYIIYGFMQSDLFGCLCWRCICLRCVDIGMVPIGDGGIYATSSDQICDRSVES